VIQLKCWLTPDQMDENLIFLATGDPFPQDASEISTRIMFGSDRVAWCVTTGLLQDPILIYCHFDYVHFLNGN